MSSLNLSLIPPILGASKLYNAAYIRPWISPPTKPMIGIMITAPTPKMTRKMPMLTPVCVAAGIMEKIAPKNNA